jgi:hypothetical protein
MQNTYNCNGEGLPNYPTDVKPKDVNVWVHDSCMISTHDYSCPVCRDKSAVLDGSTGLMQPCWGCRKKGYKLTKKLSWFQRLVSS